MATATDPIVWFPPAAGAPAVAPPAGYVYFGFSATGTSSSGPPVVWSPTATGGHATPPDGFIYVGYPDTAVPTPAPAPPTPAPARRMPRVLVWTLWGVLGLFVLAPLVAASGGFAVAPILTVVLLVHAVKKRRRRAVRP